MAVEKTAPLHYLSLVIQPFAAFHRCIAMRLHSEVSMKSISTIKSLLALVTASTLSACATGDLADNLYQPNFGVRTLNSEDNVDARLLTNGLYTPKPYGVSPYAAAPYAAPCLTAEVRCSQQMLSTWTSQDP
jgi:hypothetical protein